MEMSMKGASSYPFFEGMDNYGLPLGSIIPPLE